MSSRNITISGLVVTLLFPVVGRCRIFGDTFFQLSVVENFAFASRITLILTLDACWISQHEHKISPVSKYFVCLTSHLTTSGALIDDLTIVPGALLIGPI